MSRDLEIDAFLARQNLPPARRILAEDASFRRYLRLADGAGVLMDAPPAREDMRPFMTVQAHLSGLGLSVPQIRAADVPAGLLLLEDLGDTLFPAVLADDNLLDLYDAATDALARIHAPAPPKALPAWNADAMTAAAAATFLDWWWPARFGQQPDASIRSAFTAAMQAMLAPLGRGPAGFVHRDYFAGNLFWLQRSGARRIGIIDFQDAATGHPAYDLVSLVEDARRDLPATLKARAIARYLAQRPALDPQAFRDAYDACAVHRHLRVAALWIRLAVRDGKRGYLRHGPRTWRLLAGALQTDAAQPVMTFMKRHVPTASWNNPDV